MPPCASIASFLCSICCEDQPLSAKRVLAKCSHECCSVCLQQVIQACDQPKPLCPFCRTKLAKKDIRSVVAKERRVAVIEPDRIQRAARANVDEFTRLWLEEHTRPCPSCGWAIERTNSTLLESSSETMRCPCGCSFCYACGSESRVCVCSEHTPPFEEGIQWEDAAIEDILLEQERNTLLLEHAQNTNALVDLDYNQLVATTHSVTAAEIMPGHHQPQRRSPPQEYQDGSGSAWNTLLGLEHDFRLSETPHSFSEEALQLQRSALARQEGQNMPAMQDGEQRRRPKTTYRGVSHNSGTGELCLTDKGLIYYPSSGRREKIKVGWKSVAEDRFHPLCLALELQRKKKGRTHFFGMRDAKDFLLIEQDLVLRLKAYNNIRVETI